MMFLPTKQSKEHVECIFYTRTCVVKITENLTYLTRQGMVKFAIKNCGGNTYTNGTSVFVNVAKFLQNS